MRTKFSYLRQRPSAALFIAAQQRGKLSDSTVPPGNLRVCNVKNILHGITAVQNDSRPSNARFIADTKAVRIPRRIPGCCTPGKGVCSNSRK